MAKVTNGFLLLSVFFFPIIIVIFIFFIDRPLAIFIGNNLGSINEATTPAILFIETVFGFTISKYLFGFIAI